MSDNAIRLALKYYGDATAFVSILQANQLEDWFLNPPVITSASATSPSGSSVIIIPPTNAVRIEDQVTGPSIMNYSVVTSVMQNYETPGGVPFCSCSVKGEPQRVLPQVGKWLSTTVTISPALSDNVNIGTPVTFSTGQGRPLQIPAAPPRSQRGLPS